MERWRLAPSNLDFEKDERFARVCEALKAGQLVAVPTETVYGLAADATNGLACAGIYEAKGRPQFNPLISHVESVEAARLHGVFNEDAEKLAAAFWPGPLTLVLPRRETSNVSTLATAGLDSIAIRVPNAPIMQALARATGCPLAAPSANLSGRISGTTADDVINDLEAHLAFIIDAGATTVGVESTIISLIGEQPTLLRPGGIAREDVEKVLGKKLVRAGTDDSAPAAPGMLTSHYAPRGYVRLNASEVHEGEALINFGSAQLAGQDKAAAVINLSTEGSLTEAASRLFIALREADKATTVGIAVVPVPEEGLGEAINDRLSRAAAPRT
ncbi:L-threonylcarbamoyladenylate synthase [Pseudovibrio sp. SPO723]|uniref:L-threonylcarbamoyladenylate synthase n=1 Tax=Nesiotobacter zosterae TaxID=392721 RepID=UPI0029C4438C|nr:L-threonylcarbamoyladenylate synthase [Pseudovibrio sp. SPO723]MDX5593125.1 L-threonylcarbamoyladenylate synthase [Pseudovibrio sp. SPO723]